MKIYIEKAGEFYHRPIWWFCENTADYDCDDTTKTTKRDFEIGARVYFEGVGWTEVVETLGCGGCIFYASSYPRIPRCHRQNLLCTVYERANGGVIFKKIETIEEPTESTPDPVSHPTHYTGRVPGIECIQVTQHFNFNRGNAIKYIWRAGEKDKTKEKEDLLKARQYIDFELKRLEEEESRK